MSSGTNFDSTKRKLQDVIKAVHQHEIQLPDFQRDWIWDDDRILSLLASIAQSFPIGTVMLLETGSEEYKFKERLVEGAGEKPDRSGEELILDGQQRITSLYQTLRSKNIVHTVDSRGKKIKRWYYVDMNKALGEFNDLEDAFISIPESRIVKGYHNEVVADYSDENAEFEQEIFPLNQIFDSSDWRVAYGEYWDHDREKIKKFNDFEKKVIKVFEQYELPIIKLFKSTPKEAVCLVFEKVNTGGVSLTVFELLTATFAAEEFDLREDWKKIKGKLHSRKSLRRLNNTDVLQTITLLASYKRREGQLQNGAQENEASPVSCKRKDILKLDLNSYRKWIDDVVEGYKQADRFLHEQNIFTSKDVPYQSQINPLAAILAELGDFYNRDDAREKLSRWFWCGVLGELYGSSTETRIAKDLPEVVAWIKGETDKKPTTVTEANFNPSRLLTLKTRNSAAYKGLNALLMKEGGKDFRSGEEITQQEYFEDNIDIHHIFPRKWCKERNIEKDHYDSIVNKTPLSSKTNRMIGGNAPSIYLEKIIEELQMPGQRMDEILRSHVIDPDYLKNDDFTGFFERRVEELLLRIENVTGNEVDVEDLDKLSLDGEYVDEIELESNHA